MVAYWSLRPRLDWLIAATVGGAWWLLARYWWTSPLDGVTAESRRAVYEQVSNFGMAALALFVLPLSIMLAVASGERLARILATKRTQVREVVIQAAIAAVVVIVVAAIAVSLDTMQTPATAQVPGGERENDWLRAVVPAAFVLNLMGVARVVRVFAALLVFRDADTRPSMADQVEPVSRADAA